jgi:hypothetical protein
MEKKQGRFGQASTWKTISGRLHELLEIKFDAGEQMKGIKQEASKLVAYHTDKSKEMRKILKGIERDNLKCFWSNKYTRKEAFKTPKKK